MGVLRPELARFSGVSAREVRRTYYLALVRTHTRHVQHLPHRGFRHANLACDVTILLAFAERSIMSARIASVITLRGLARFFSCRSRSRIRSAIFGGSTGKAHG